jgi:peptide chain release factor 1
MQTSSVTVSVINPNVILSEKHTTISDKDFKVEWFSGTGKGGQHRNKRMNSCKLMHIPSGIVETRQGRKREANLREAKAALLARLQQMRQRESNWIIGETRKNQVGSGMRGDKIRTYRFQDDMVHDHNSNSRAKCAKVMKGHFDLLWK